MMNNPLRLNGNDVMNKALPFITWWLNKYSHNDSLARHELDLFPLSNTSPYFQEY